MATKSSVLQSPRHQLCLQDLLCPPDFLSELSSISLSRVHLSFGHNERLIRGEDEQREELEFDKQEGRKDGNLMWDDGRAREWSEIVESIEAEAIKMRELVTVSEKNLCWNYISRCLKQNSTENYKSAKVAALLFLVYFHKVSPGCPNTILSLTIRYQYFLLEYKSTSMQSNISTLTTIHTFLTYFVVLESCVKWYWFNRE